MKETVLLFTLLCMISCAPKSLPTVFILTADKVELKLSYMSTRSELEEISTQLLEQKDIKLDFSKSTFFEDGKLRDVALEVTLPNGKVGRSSVMLAHIQNQYFGFTLGENGNFKIGTVAPN